MLGERRDYQAPYKERLGLVAGLVRMDPDTMLQGLGSLGFGVQGLGP